MGYCQINFRFEEVEDSNPSNEDADDNCAAVLIPVNSRLVSNLWHRCDNIHKASDLMLFRVEVFSEQLKAAEKSRHLSWGLEAAQMRLFIHLGKLVGVRCSIIQSHQQAIVHTLNLVDILLL